MIVFSGMSPSREVAKILFAEFNLRYGKDYVLAENHITTRYVNKDHTLVICGLKYAQEFGLSKKLKLRQTRGKKMHLPQLGREVFIVTNINNRSRNTNVVPQFISDMRTVLGIKSEFNLTPEQQTVKTPDELPQVASGVFVSFDVESTGTVFYKRLMFPRLVDKVLFAVIAFDYDKAYFVDAESFMKHKKEWQSWLEKDYRFVTHGGVFDIKAMHSLGLQLRSDFDTLMAHHRLYSRQIHKLKEILQNRYGLPDYDAELDKYIYKDESKNSKYDKVPIAVFKTYAALDGVYELRLAKDLEKELIDENMMETFLSVDMYFLRAIAKNAKYGRHVDYQSLLLAKLRELEPTIREIVERLRRLSSRPKLNPGSQPQIKNVLAEFKYPYWNPKTGKTSKPVIEKLLTHNLTDIQREFLEKLVEYRTLRKIVTSYIDVITKNVSIDGKLYPHYNVAGAINYRISVVNPAMQTIPKTAEGVRVRRAFVHPDKNMVYTHVDGSGSQLRTAASLSGDSVMLNIFNTGGDIHNNTLQPIYSSLPAQYQDPSLARRIAKGTNFAMIFNATIWTLRTRMPFVPKQIISLLYHSFRAQYHEYMEWSDSVMTKAERNLCLYNKFGYKQIYLKAGKKTRNEASNFPISSAEAYVMNKTYAQVSDRYRVVLHLHDELVVLHHIDESKQVAEFIMRTMLKNYLEIGTNITWKVEGVTKRNWKPEDKKDVFAEWSMESTEL